MRPTLRQLEYFVAVAEHQAFGPAAESLNVTQPSLSKQIATLEAELELALFERNSRSVRLSRAGHALLADAQALLAQARSLREHARRLARDGVGRLQAGVLPSIGAYFIPRLRERLKRSFPHLRLSLVEGGSRELLTRLDDGALDFVIASSSHFGGFQVRPLFEETLWICSAPNAALMSDTTPVALHELAGETLLTLSPDFHLSEIVQDLADRAGAKINSDYRGASLDAIRQMAARGEGVAILPSLYALDEAVRDPDFKVRRLAHSDAVHPVLLYWRRASAEGALFEQLGAEMIAEKLKIRSERGERFKL